MRAYSGSWQLLKLMSSAPLAGSLELQSSAHYDLTSSFNSPILLFLDLYIYLSSQLSLRLCCNMFIVSFLSLFTLSVLARDVVFPPLAAVHTSRQYFSPFKDDPAILLAGADFHGLSTYANLPYVKCMSSEEKVEKYDIAILGAPFDTVSFFVFNSCP
jgi:hypothetical protein